MKFTDLNLSNQLLNSINDIGFEDCTNIQAKSFSAIMSGTDTVGIAQTGTGKTLAFLLPCMNMWKYSNDRFPQILVIVPTRELVVQIVEQVNQLAEYMNFKSIGVYGGANINVQSDAVQEKFDLLVGTPGRVTDLILNGSIKTKKIRKFVIDEMDEMLNLGFRHQIINLIDLLPEKRQNLLFSATLEKDVEVFIEQFFSNYKIVEAAPPGTTVDEIEQMAYNVPNFYSKVNFLNHYLNREQEFLKVLVFVSSKKIADLIHELLDEKIAAECGVMHSNRSQNKRFEIVKQFKRGEIRIIIATDIIARGLDIESVSHVINFDVHEKPENYIHRIGRTGRAGEKGVAISLVSEEELLKFHHVEALMRQKVQFKELPPEIELTTKKAPHEEEVIEMPIIHHKIAAREDVGPAFHEKKEKNKKVNVRMSRADKMKLKYKKAQTRGQKKRKKK